MAALSMSRTAARRTPLTTALAIARLNSDSRVYLPLLLLFLLCRTGAGHKEVFVILLLFGPPGCGKGTQAEYLAERLHIPAISTGEMFRAECKAGTELGKAACSILSSGGLVSDELVNGIVANRIARADCRDGFLLDGYPRTVPQAIHLSGVLRERGLPEPVVIHLDVADEALVTRLTARRQCPQCLRSEERRVGK